MKKLFKGSALVYSLIILFVMLTVVLAMSAVSINERNNAGTTGNSVQAFQTANSGSELFAKVLASNPPTVGAIASSFGGCNAGTGNLTGSITGGGTYTIELLQTDGTTQVNCSTDAALAANTVASIKSTGTFSGSSRAIQVAMAASTILGSWGSSVSAPMATPTQAGTDGLVVGYASSGSLTGKTDGSNPPTTTRVVGPSITMPVRSGDYWQVTGTGTVYWVSL